MGSTKDTPKRSAQPLYPPTNHPQDPANHSETHRELIHKAVNDSKLPDLEWTTILGAFHEEGIESLEDLAKKLVKTFRNPLSFPQPLDTSILSRRTSKSAAATIVHKVPKYPVLCNGVVYDPADIVRFNGQPLLYIVGSAFRDTILLVDDPETTRTFLTTYIFSALVDKWRNWIDIAESKAVPPSNNPPLNPTDLGGGGPIIITPPPPTQGPGGDPKFSPSPDLRLFSRSSFQGSSLVVHAGFQWSDLTEAYIFYPFDDWNDEINSMLPTTSTHIFKEHINFEGSFLMLPKHYIIYNFGDYGWDARVSSVANYG